MSCARGLRVFPLASDHLHVGSGSLRRFFRESGHAARRQRSRKCGMCVLGECVPERCADDGVRPSLSECGTVHAGFALQLSASQMDEYPFHRRSVGTVLGADHPAHG